MAELGVAGSAVGIVSLGIQVCQGLVKYYGSWKDAPKEVAQMCDSVLRLEETLKLLRTAMKDNGVATQVEAGVESNINACLSSIKGLQLELTKVEEVKGSTVWSKVHGQARRLLYPFRESTLLKLRTNVAEIRENLSLAVDVLNLERTSQSGEKLDHISAQVNDLALDIRSHHNDEKSKAIMNWLSPLNFSAMQADTLQRRQEGTGEWLFKTPEFEAWLAGTDRILWCSGLPGAGKTILASAIIDKLQTRATSQDVGLAFAYCYYKVRERQTVANLIGSIIRQLVRHHSTIPKTILALFEKHNLDGTGPREGELVPIFLSLLAEFSHVYIVVDALDECYPETRSRLITILKESSANLHLLCTSRHVGDIQESFADASHLDIEASDADVALYLEAQILQTPRLSKYCKKVGDLQRCIIEKVSEKAKGMFLLATLHIESLKLKTDIKSLRKALDVLPEGRDKTYDEALERIQMQPVDESKLAMRVLLWIIHATRPLKVGEIQHAIAVMNFEPEETTIDEEGLTDEAELITACGGIVVIDEHSGVIRLVHYTTQEYFERKRKDVFPTASVDILCACVRYLSMEPIQKSDRYPYFEVKRRMNKYKLLDYASANWFFYVEDDIDKQRVEQVLHFLDNEFLVSTLSVLYHNHPFWYSSLKRLCGEEGWVSGLFVAAYFGLTTIVSEILRLRGNLKEMAPNRTKLLHVAAEEGHEDVIRLLLQEGAEVDARDDYGMTPLYIAVENGYEAIVRLLLQEGAEVDARADNGTTPLHNAAGSEQEAIVRLLLQEAAGVDARDSNGRTPLHNAAESGHEAIVRLLLQEAAEVDARDDYGRTLLHIAVENGYEAIVRLLLQAGADTKATDNYGKTALQIAIEAENEGLAKLLTPLS